MDQDQHTFVEGRSIIVDNHLFEVKMTQEFIDRVKHRFSLRDNDIVTDDHVKRFIREAMIDALFKSGV